MLMFHLLFGGGLGGSWEAGLGLEILPKTVALTPLNISPIGFTQPSFVKVFDMGVRVTGNTEFIS